jgi:hypothetical protein
MPDYCYSDRLRLEYETHISNPELSGFACYNITFRLSFLPASRDSGTKCHSGAGTYFPKDIVSVSDNPGPKPVVGTSRYLSTEKTLAVAQAARQSGRDMHGMIRWRRRKTGTVSACSEHCHA